MQNKTVMDPIDIASGLAGSVMVAVTCIKQDKCKAAILTDTGFIRSGQRARKDKWDTLSWITVICFGKHRLSATLMIISNEKGKGSGKIGLVLLFLFLSPMFLKS